MPPGKKYTLLTGIFYLSLYPLYILSRKLVPSGPCTPGLELIVMLYGIITAFSGLIVSFVGRVFKGYRPFTGPLIINAVACSCAVIFYINA